MESGRRKIIVADESHAFVMNMSILLKRMGFSVIPAENSEEVIRLMKIMHADLAMLDATLQDDEGFAVLRRIRKGFWTRKLPVIMFIPRENATRYLEQCEEFGATGHLMKPVNIIELHEVLQECLFVPKGITRRFMRTEYRDRIELSIGDQALEAYTVSLSEGGIYIRTSEPLPEGTRVSLNLPIREDRSLAVRGTVLYTKGLFGDIMKLP
ncbi:MAG: response regulator, partial [Desulfobacterales bacterium]|nr:response regulator [Desulfobacterales bacterium]